jgi:hypothetical protein
MPGFPRKLLLASVFLLVPSAAFAGEGGAGVYVQGTYNDFAVAAPKASIGDALGRT